MPRPCRYGLLGISPPVSVSTSCCRSAKNAKSIKQMDFHKIPVQQHTRSVSIIGNVGCSVDLLESCNILLFSFFVWFPKISSKQWNINIHGPNKIHSWLRSYRTHSDIVADDLTRHGHCKRLEQYAVASVMIIQFTNMSRQNALSPVYTNKHMKHTESVRVVFMLMDPLDLFLHDKHSKGFSAQKAVFFSFCLRFVWDGARWSRCTENPSYRSQTSGHRQSQFHMFFPLAYWLFYMKQQKPTRLECSIVE